MPIEPSDLVGSAEIADRLGVRRETIHLWRRRDLGFPEPLVELQQAMVWSWSEVERWARSTGRLPA